MSKLNFGDIVALAKQGYKPADIKELMSLDIPDNETPATEPGASLSGATLSDPNIPTPEPTPALNDTETPAKATGQPVESDEDKARIAELEKQIKDLQATNQAKDVSGNIPDPQKSIDDLVRSFM